MNEDIKLRCCPFCGGEAKLINKNAFWIVDCQECFASSTWLESKTEAMDAWNMRTYNKQCKLAEICRLYSEQEGK